MIRASADGVEPSASSVGDFSHMHSHGLTGKISRFKGRMSYR